MWGKGSCLPLALLCAGTLLAGCLMAEAQSVTVSPTSLSFGNQAEGTTSTAKTVTLKNGLSSAITIASISSSLSDFAPTDHCPVSPATLAAGGTCTISVTFTPSATGSRTGTLTISEVGISKPQTVSLSGTGTAPILVSIAVTPATASVVAGNTQQFTAMGTYSNGSQQTLTATWTSSATSVATVKSATGLATGVAQGTATITATSGKITGSATLTVTPPVLTSIAVTPTTASVAAGNTEQYTATGTYSNGSKQNLTSSVQWASSSTAVATVNSAGLATGVAQGKATISATSGTIVGTASLTVTAAVLTSIAVTPSTPSIAAGNTQQFTATGTYSNGTQKKLTTATWASSATSVATISSTGLATGVAQGTATITATSGTIQGSVTLTVTPAVLESIAVTPATASIPAGNTQQFTATGTYSNGSQQNLTSSVQWSSLASAVATVSSGGLATGVAQGAATIIATSGSITGSAALTVTAPVLTSLAVTPVNASFALGTTQQMTATGTYSDGSTLNLTNTVTWSTGNGAIASVNGQGLVSSVAVGSTGVTATSGAIVGTTQVTVTPAQLVSIAVTPAIPTIALGLTQQFTATGTYTDASQQNITGTVAWSSDTPAVATIVSGEATAGLATSVGQGTATITASVGSVSGSTQLTVTAAVLETIAVTPATLGIPLGTTQQFTATGTFSDGSTQNLTSTATWSSDTTRVATISNTAGTVGLATSVGQGTAGITASVGGVSGTTELTVTAAALVSIAVSPGTGTIPLGDTQQFTALGTYTDGNQQDVTQTGHWSSTNGGAATISNTQGTNGLATSVAVGSTTVGISLTGVNATATLAVNPAALVSIAISPTGASIPLGTSQQFTATGTYTDNSTQDLTSVVTWSTSAATVAIISNGVGSYGLLTSAGQGTTTVTATLGSVSSSTNLTVAGPALVSITIAPAGSSIPLGTSQQFNATGTYTDGSTQNLTASAAWASDSPAVAPVTAGLVNGTAMGTANISATSGTVTSSVSVAVTAPLLLSISVTPATASVPAGESQLFTATGTYSNGSTQNLTSSVAWTSSSSSVSTISSAGLATAVTQGAVTITATLGTISGSGTLTVTAAVLTSISITPAGASVPAGESQQFTATGTYSNGSTQNLTSSAAWTSSSSSVSTISSAGLATAVTQGAVTITATLGTISGSATLTVTAAVLTSISVTPATASVPAGESQLFAAVGTYSDGSQQNLTSTVNWSTSLATVATIGSGGSATGVGIGTAGITATLGSVTSAAATLSVGQPVLVSMAVTPGNASFALGTTQQMTATGTYSDGSTLNLTNAVTWGTGNGAIATANGQGLASSVAVGSTGVTATSGAISGSANLTVTAAVLVSIAVTPAIPTIPLGTTQQFTATGTYTDNSQQNITGTVQWSSDTPAVVTISNAANAQGLASSVGQGTATITAAAGTVTGSTTLAVSSAVLVSLAITPATPSLALGTQQQFTATGTFTDGSTQNLTSTVTWSSDTPSTATINNAGMASSAAAGTANISAVSGSVTTSTLLTVTPAVLVSIAINPPTATIPLGTTQPFTATGTFTDGTTQDITQSGQWSSTAATVATISNSAATAGLATTLGTGTTTIGISSGGVNATGLLTVNPAVLASISITPQSFTIALGTSQQMTATGTYTDGGTQNVTSLVTWSTSNATVAIISNTLGSYGLATTSGQGAATITATSGSISASTTITVGQATAISITVTPSSISIIAGSTEQFTAVAIYSDGSTQDVTQSATWASSNPNVALVSSSGLATATLVGTTTVSASTGSATGSAVLTVNAASLPVSAIPLTFFAVSDSNPLVPPLLNYGTLGHPILLAWQSIEQASGVFDFSVFDEYANIAPKDANGTALMIMTLGMTPPWALPVTGTATCRTSANSAGGTGCTAPPDHIQDWINFITALISHYNGSTAPHIKYYELWNEADPKSPYWTGTAAQLEQLAAAAYPIIKQDPYSFVITPSMSGNVHASGSSSTLTFFSNYLAAGGNQYADIASFHGLVASLGVVPYPLPTQDCSGSSSTCGGSITAQVSAYRQVLAKNGMSTTPLFNTEGGFESAAINLDTGAAWLAQYYALQAAMYKTSQLQLVSWFAWDTNDGQLETGHNNLTEVGVAYDQVSRWLVGNTLSTPCSNSGTIWTCAMTGANGYQAEIIWDSSQTCTNGTCTYSNQSVASTPYTQYLDLAGDPPITITNETVPVGLKPILLQNQ